MKIYRIKHKETGLYYNPSNANPWRVLSSLGKLYHNKPSKTWLMGMNRRSYLNNPKYKTEDFIIVECKVIDTKEIEF
jgi:hypothetical protein